MELKFRYMEIDTSRGLQDEEYSIKGKGIIVLSAPLQCFIKINSKLSDPIPAISIEQLRMDIEKIYVTTPPDNQNLKLIVIQDKNVYVDANSNYDVAASIGAFLSAIVLTGARRGNKLEIHVLDPSEAPITIQDLYIEGPYLIDNLIGFTILEGIGDDWILTSEALHPGKAGEKLTSTVDLSGLGPGDKVELIGHTYVFSAGANASPLKIAVTYLYLPIWGK